MVARHPLVETGKVYVPRCMNRLRVLPPQTVHLVCIVGVGAVRKGVVVRGSTCESVPPTDQRRRCGSERPGRAGEGRETTDDDAPGKHFGGDSGGGGSGGGGGTWRRGHYRAMTGIT